MNYLNPAFLWSAVWQNKQTIFYDIFMASFTSGKHNKKECNFQTDRYAVGAFLVYTALEIVTR